MPAALLAALAAMATPSPCGNAEALLIHARAALHARALPPYVVYTLTRADTLDGAPDAANSYALRVWYRTADGAALTRRIDGGRAGPLVFERPRFDAALDPGPPTADIFEPAPPRARAQATAAPVDSLRTIGVVRTPVEIDYRAEAVECDSATVHLRLTARRDPDRNRLRDVWLDRKTIEVQRFVADDRLYDGQTDLWVPDVFDATLERVGDLRVISTIHGDAVGLGGARSQSAYRFEAIAFPPAVPDWYFEPGTYGAHAKDAPQ